jgi:hypothetical protein
LILPEPIPEITGTGSSIDVRNPKYKKPEKLDPKYRVNPNAQLYRWERLSAVAGEG